MREDTPLILARLDFLQADLVGDVVKLSFADGFEPLAARGGLFLQAVARDSETGKLYAVEDLPQREAPVDTGLHA